MAQLLSPVRADALLRFQSRRSSSAAAPFALWRGSRLGRPANGSGRRAFRCRRRSGFCVNAATVESLSQEDVADDYYAALGLLPDATPEQIKKAYYNCMKACHPDLSGNNSETNNFCMFINEVYAVLSDPVQRMVYDEIQGYSTTGTNPFLDDTSPRDHAFVDEFSCILTGCKNCANVAPDVFQIEEDFGRERVFCQSGNLNLVEQAIESCPVDCIHWTSAAQLLLLEDEMRRVERVNVGLMLAGIGSLYGVFRMASKRWEKRQSKILQKAKVKMMKQKDSGSKESYWDNLWGRPKNYENTDEEIKERAGRAAAATLRWREYSRKGADRRPTFKLPEAVAKNEK